MRRHVSTGAAAAAAREEVTKQAPDRQTIEARAYELWVMRGCPIGSPEVDWLQAELELSEAAAPAAHSHAA